MASAVYAARGHRASVRSGEETEGPLLKTQNEAVLVSKAFSFSCHLALELSSCFRLPFDISPSKGDLGMFIFGTDFTLCLYVVQR